MADQIIAIEDDVKCGLCGIKLEVGMFPFCRGNPANHGRSSISKTSIFPFTVSHVDGKPMQIESLQHLRKVEKDYGVAFSAFSKANINDTDPLRDPPTYRGDEHRRR